MDYGDLNDDIECEENADEEAEDEEFSKKFYFLKNTRCANRYAKKRQQPKVIRFVHYDRCKDIKDYYRELIMLFTSWRNELIEVININCEEEYFNNIITIEKNKSKYYFYNKNDSRMLETIEENVIKELTDDPTPINDKEDESEFVALDTEHMDIDIYETMCLKVTDRVEKFTKPKQYDYSEYNKLVVGMNRNQRKY